MLRSSTDHLQHAPTRRRADAIQSCSTHPHNSSWQLPRRGVGSWRNRRAEPRSTSIASLICFNCFPTSLSGYPSGPRKKSKVLGCARASSVSVRGIRTPKLAFHLTRARRSKARRSNSERVFQCHLELDGRHRVLCPLGRSAPSRGTACRGTRDTRPRSPS
jgi:hypothetical protein